MNGPPHGRCAQAWASARDRGGGTLQGLDRTARQECGRDSQHRRAALTDGLQALIEFPGSAIVISHDRWFLDRVCTHILAFEGEGRVEFYTGSYSDYERYRQNVLGLATDPSRIKHKRLVTGGLL